jgi:hypothetical protein
VAQPGQRGTTRTPIAEAASLGGPASLATTVRRLQRAYGNQAVQRLVAGPRMLQRDDLSTFVASLADASDMAMLGVMLPTLDAATRTAVAKQLGVSRFKDLIFVLGEDTVMQIGREGLLALSSIEDLARLTSVPIGKTLDVARRWKALPIQNFADHLGAAVGPQGIDFPTAMRLCNEQQESLKERLRLAIQRFPVTVDELRPYIDSAPQVEREAVSNDTALMGLARSNLSEDEYLALLPALRTYKPATTIIKEATAGSKWISHMRGDEADVYIRAQLGGLVKDAVRAGRKVEGEVSVVDDADFEVAFRRQWTPILGASTTATLPRVNAFVDVSLPKRHIWVHKDRGNAGTVVHEGMHKYADPTLRNELIRKYPGAGPDAGVSQLDEGITEYFTREVTNPLGIVRGNYAEPFKIAAALAGAVGKTVLASAYFDGQFDGLKAVYMSAKGKSMTDWESFAKAAEGKQWSTARTYL